MLRVTRITNVANKGSARAGAAWRSINAQPSWIVRAVSVAFVLVIGIPIMLLVLFALTVALMLFAALWTINLIVLKIRGALPARDGRENVRVIRRP